MKKGEDLNRTEANNIKIKLRHLARLLQLLREKTDIEGGFIKFSKPKFYDMFVAVVWELREISKQMAIAFGN